MCVRAPVKVCVCASKRERRRISVADSHKRAASSPLNESPKSPKPIWRCDAAASSISFCPRLRRILQLLMCVCVGVWLEHYFELFGSRNTISTYEWVWGNVYTICIWWNSVVCVWCVFLADALCNPNHRVSGCRGVMDTDVARPLKSNLHSFACELIRWRWQVWSLQQNNLVLFPKWLSHRKVLTNIVKNRWIAMSKSKFPI